MFAFENQRMLRKLAVFVAVMFAFGFALVPIYKKICDASRSVRIEFDANTRNLPWNFKPEVTALTVHPGELTTVVYEVTNTTARAMTGQAIPSYGPSSAAEHFKKLECFCFAKQTFDAQEVRQMPVVFVVDRDLPRDVNTITLSYTFFEMPGSGPAVSHTPPGKLEAASSAKLPG